MAAPATDSTTYAAMLKTLYPPGVPENVATRDREWLSLVPKKEDFYGKNMVVPIVYGNPQGRSASIANAITNTGSSSSVAWTITRAHDYQVITLDTETMLSSEKNEGAFVEAAKHEVDTGLDELGKSASVALYGTGSGSLGKIATSGITTTTITLTSKHDARNFAKGQVCVLSSADGGGSVRSGTITVAGVAYATGKITFTGNVTSGISAAADADYIFTQGDYDAKMKGLEAWIPLATPSATLFFGVDRTPDVERLAGWRLDQSGDIGENLITLGELVSMGGGRPDIVLINGTNYGNLIKGLGTKVVYNNGEKALIGATGAAVNLSKGRAEIVVDAECPANRAWLLTKKSWCLHHLKAFPHLAMDDGNRGLRGATYDGLELRARYYAQLVCNAPAWNGVMSIT